MTPNGGARSFSRGKITPPFLGGLAGGGNVALTTAALEPVAIDVVGGNNQSTSYGGVLSGAGGLTVSVTGTLTLGNSQNYSGPTTVTGGGTLRLGPPVNVTASYATSGTYSFTPASNNLLAGLSPSANTNTLGGQQGNNSVNTGTSAALTDGLVSNTGVEATDLPSIYTIGSGAQITYTLPSSPFGYNLSKINLYSEWNDNGRSEITLSGISYSTVANPTVFITIPNSSVNYTSGLRENLATLTAPGGLLASGVDAVQFDFGSQQNGWVGYSELEVVGTPTVVNNVLPITTPLTVAPTATFDLAGRSQQVASLSDSSPGSGGSVINSAASTTSVLTFSPTSGSTTFSGVIGGGSGTISVAMNGAGTQVLAGLNTYTGGTAVNNGTLRVANSTGSATGTGVSPSATEWPATRRL